MVPLKNPKACYDPNSCLRSGAMLKAPDGASAAVGAFGVVAAGPWEAVVVFGVPGGGGGTTDAPVSAFACAAVMPPTL